MKRRLFALAALTLFAGSAPAIDLGFGLFKKRAEKKEAAKEVSADKQNIATLESDRDEAKRKAAAAALRSSDPKPNFDAVAALSRAATSDPSPDVRATAAESLASFKVVYQQAVTALEKAEADDPNADVRAAAKAALKQYALSGYKPTTSVAKLQSNEPPLAKPPMKFETKPAVVVAAKPTVPSVPDAQFRTITQGPGTVAPFTQSQEPPLARPAAKTPPPATPVSNPTTAPQPLPTLVPQRMPSTVEQPKAEQPKAELPKVELPTIAPPMLPLPSVPALPTLPQPKPVPTVQPPK